MADTELDGPRVIAEGELSAWWAAVSNGFGESVSMDLTDDRTVLALDRVLAIHDGDDVVATANDYPSQVIVPGGRRVDTALVSQVTTRATHRRRGLLRSMMSHQLDLVAERGEALALLTASEGSIYRRFGYGIATEMVTATIDTRDLGLLAEPAVGGRFRMVGGSDRETIVAPLFDEIERRAGTISRSEAWWRIVLGPRANYKGGRSPFLVVHEDQAGRPDGFVTYHVHQPRGTDTSSTVVIIDLVGDDRNVELALWRFVADIDLSWTVKMPRAPVDLVLSHQVVDRRQVRVDDRRDDLWLRLLDIEAAFAARSLHDAGMVMVDVTDPFRPQSSGTYRLSGEGMMSVDSRSQQADLALDVADLGSLFLGGSTVDVLHRAGLIEERRPGSVVRADAILATPQPPYSGLRF